MLALLTDGAIATVDLGTGRRARQITAGCWHTCALLEDGDVKCWGLNNWGQVSLGECRNVFVLTCTQLNPIAHAYLDSWDMKTQPTAAAVQARWATICHQ